MSIKLVFLDSKDKYALYKQEVEQAHIDIENNILALDIQTEIDFKHIDIISIRNDYVELHIAE